MGWLLILYSAVQTCFFSLCPLSCSFSDIGRALLCRKSNFGYPQLFNAFLMCSSSLSLSSSVDTSVSFLSINVLTTPDLWCIGWWDWKCRYWSVCVGLRYTYGIPMTVFWSRAQHQHHVTTSLMKLAVGERNVATNLGINYRLCQRILF